MRTTAINHMTSIEDDHWWFREKRHLLATELRKLGAPGRALDVGAAGGGNSRVLAAAGWSTLACDLSEAGVETARARGIDAVQADARDLPMPDSSFDLVTAFEVLEHIEQDDVAVAEMFRVLRPGGTLLVTVPSGMDLWSAHDVAVDHVRRYDREQLLAVVQDAGFVLDELWSWNVVMRRVAASRRRSLRGSELDANKSWLVDRALRLVIRVERHLPVRSLDGVSLILKAHKP